MGAKECFQRPLGPRLLCSGISSLHLWVALCLAPIGLVVMPGSALAGETHLFSAEHSLTGSCVVNSLDPVPDPGCPSEHAPEALSKPSRVVLDAFGDQYILNGAFFEDLRIDVFDADGRWLLTETQGALLERLGETYEQYENLERAVIHDIEVDSKGYLYISMTVGPAGSEERDLVLRYSPTSVPPSRNTVFDTPKIIFDEHNARSSLAVGPDDSIYLDFGPWIGVFSSAETENMPIEQEFGGGTLANSSSVAVGADGTVFASSTKPGANPIPSASEPFVSQVYVLDGTTGDVIEEIDGSDTPNCAQVGSERQCGFSSSFGQLDLMVERSTGDLYVSDKLSSAIYQFHRNQATGAYEYVEDSKLEHSFSNSSSNIQAVAFDNGSSSPDQGYLYVTSSSSAIGHIYAFAPRPEVGPPVIAKQEVTGISTDEARLQAQIDPNGAVTRYWFEYVDEATYMADLEDAGAGHGFDHATAVPQPPGSLAANAGARTVTEAVFGLLPGTIYRFRAVAENCTEQLEDGCMSKGEGSSGEEGTVGRFSTYPTNVLKEACPNQAFRTGRSAVLPDCRAYELVTPPDPNGLSPFAFNIGFGISPAWSAPLAGIGGETVLYATKGGSLPGLEGTGSLDSDGYRARRSPTGWRTEAAGLSGQQSQGPIPGSPSPDGEYWSWATFSDDKGSLGPNGNFVRGPDGTVVPVGQGSLASGGDPHAIPRWITAAGTHRIFTSSVRLEQDSPPAGTTAVYDRTNSVTKLVSLLPGDVTPTTDASYQGASADGSVVSFAVDGTLYVRIDDTATFPVVNGTTTFAGLSEDGRWLTYLKDGNIFSFDTATGTTTEIGSGGESTPVNVSADGSHIYFVSPRRLLSGKGVSGKDNFYVWNRADGSLHFIALLAHLDVTGTETSQGTLGALGLWAQAVGPAQYQFLGRATDPSRTTPDGSVLVFESHAALTGQSLSAEPEVYRYDADDDSLLCISCDPTLSGASGDSGLLSVVEEGGVLNSLAEIPNVAADGDQVFFESTRALVPNDVNGVNDVYEWHAEEPGTCDRPAGCLFLLSSGQGRFPSFLYGATPGGRDVFILTGDLLLDQDWDETPSLYDARVEGGFPEPEPSSCTGESCRGRFEDPPTLTVPATAGAHGPKRRVKRHCRGGKRKVRVAGKVRCIAKSHHHPHHRRGAKHVGGSK